MNKLKFLALAIIVGAVMVSCGGKKYKGKLKTRMKWRSFRSIPGKGYKIKTLFFMAKMVGFPPRMIYAEVARLKNCRGDQDAA